MKQRGEVGQDVWATARQQEIAQQISTILAEACWNEHFSFHPSDPWAVIGDVEIGNLDELDAVWRIEKAFGLPSPCRELWDRVSDGLTLEDVVNFIVEHERRQTSRDEPHFSQTKVALGP